MDIENIAKQFDEVALEYDFVVSLTKEQDNILIKNMPNQRNKVLDIGCGSGNKSIFLSTYFKHVVGIDISDSFLKIADHKKNSKGIENITFLNMDAEKMEFDEKFDMIVSRTTFHHLNIANVLESCVSLLNKGGVIYIKDNVSDKPTPARWTYIAGSFIEFLPDCIKYGFKNAKRKFSHNISKDWLYHLSTDKYLSETEYQNIYEKYLPKCTFIREGWAMNVIWKKSIF